MPTTTAIRASLPTNARLLAMNNAQKKEAAEQGLKAILIAVRDGKIALGDWEKISIENVILMINHGLYSVAIHEVYGAVWPEHDRSPKLNISPRTAARTLEEFDGELERLTREVAPRPDPTPEGL
jgi:hypothetical protein